MLPFQGTLVHFQGVYNYFQRGLQKGWLKQCFNLRMLVLHLPKKTEPKELNKTPWIGGTKILPVKFLKCCLSCSSVTITIITSGPIILLQFWGHVKTHIFGTKDLISHVHPLHGSHRIDVDPETFVEHGKFTFKQRCVRHIQCPYYIDPIPI